MCPWGTLCLMTPKELSDRFGGYGKVAKALGIASHSVVMRWKKIPDHHLTALEKATGIPREQLRPDLYRVKSEAA